MVVEGVYATEVAYKTAQRLDIEMPITEQIYAILYQGLSPRTANINLMTRSKTKEFLDW